MIEWIGVGVLVHKLGVARETLQLRISSGQWRARTDDEGGVRIEVASLPAAVQKKVESWERALEEQAPATEKREAAQPVDAQWFARQVELDLLPPDQRETVRRDLGALIAGRLELLDAWKGLVPRDRRAAAGVVARRWSGLAKSLAALYPRLANLPFPTVLDRILECSEKSEHPAELVALVLDLPLLINRDVLHAMHREAGSLV
jgi:hypothetical protein